MPSNEARCNLLSNERRDTFWDTLWLELWPFLYYLATVFGKIMEENGRKVKKGMPKVAYRRRMTHVMHIISLRVRPKRVHKQNIIISPTYFACPRGQKYSRKTNNVPARGGLGVILASFWCHFAHFGVTYECWAGVALVHSQNIFIFPRDFWWFYATRSLVWSHFGSNFCKKDWRQWPESDERDAKSGL